MPWLTESDIEDIPPVTFPIHHLVSMCSLHCIPDAKSPLPYGHPPQSYKSGSGFQQSLLLPMYFFWVQDIQQLSISEKQTTPQNLFSWSSPWFCIPDSLSLVCAQIMQEIPSSMVERNYKACQLLGLNLLITLPMQAPQTGRGILTLGVQIVLMTGGNFS